MKIITSGLILFFLLTSCSHIGEEHVALDKQQTVSDKSNKIDSIKSDIVEKPEIILNTLRTYHSAISVNEEQKVLFFVNTNGISEKAFVELEEINENGEIVRIVGSMNDNGENGDYRANNGQYSGEFILGPYTTEQDIRHRARFMFSSVTSESMVTGTNILPVVPFPIGRQGDYDSDKKMLVIFNEEVNFDRIGEIVSEIDAEVIDIIGMKIYVLYLSDATTTQVQDMIEELYTFPEVKSAEMNRTFIGF